ncbi:MULTISPECIES: hypothetical protein [Streptomyces]|uniref:Uncharacterized protein n=1 Tax=Streptomyces zinciresistens K42 TaxID=700597 RepID=G2GBC6_9ACTN|nr:MULTISPECIES: hypothetical protein [Streptomyces]EGX59222.1 hypothetical protein SZN_14001 [Streptomyces zinciresistens K42]MDT9696526.1 hypothetical protein [Streptomyces sp. P17]
MTTTLPLRAHVADGRYTVSTIELVDPMPDGMAFETMVFDTIVDDEVDSRRYRTSTEAVSGHAAFLREIQLIEDALAP